VLTLSIEITLDGTSEYHDKRRILKNGKGSFEIIYKNIMELCNCDLGNCNISIRCNVDNENIDSISPLLHKFNRDGLHKKINFYVAPIHSWGNDANKSSLKKEDFANYEIEWLLEMKELGFNVNYLPKRKDMNCIGTSEDGELIDPYGGIYHCSEFSLVENYKVNNKNKHEISSLEKNFKDQIVKNSRSNLYNIYNKIEKNNYPCMDCSVFPLCLGGCPKEWSEGRKPCPSFKYNIEKRVLLKALPVLREL
jgi:uncharacterized protein